MYKKFVELGTNAPITALINTEHVLYAISAGKIFCIDKQGKILLIW